MSQLADDQLVAFDTEYVDDVRWKPIEAGLGARERFSFVDIGGGNGVFADRILDRFPLASGTVADNAPLLLDRVQKRANKARVTVDALALPSAKLERVDVVFLNWVLHHLVVTGDYGRTRHNILRVLTDVRWLLRPEGRVSVYENMYDGALFHNLPSHVVFRATSLQRGSSVMRRLGANTAGVGVCFQSERSWRKLFDEAGYDVEEFTRDADWPMRSAKRAALGIKAVRCGHFWLRPTP